jgi:hypothetical protein
MGSAKQKPPLIPGRRSICCKPTFKYLCSIAGVAGVSRLFLGTCNRPPSECGSPGTKHAGKEAEKHQNLQCKENDRYRPATATLRVTRKAVAPNSGLVQRRFF